MASLGLSLDPNYWKNLTITEEDLQFLYNYLLETETPQTAAELTEVLIRERIRREIERLKQEQAAGGEIYQPKNHYRPGQTLRFPALGMTQGVVVGVRPGFNPDFPPFEVIEVEFDSQTRKEFAAGLAEHALNAPITINDQDPLLNPKYVVKHYGRDIAAKLTAEFETNPDLVRIAGAWFPRALLVDVSVGYLNLAEAVLEMAGGGPLPTQAILEQIELPSDVNPKLTEFSLNLALQEDGRFDEVGPAGQILWFLKRLEPEAVQTPPMFLKYVPADLPGEPPPSILQELNRLVFDELENQPALSEDINEVTLSLIFPHWRAGTLPLTGAMVNLFPTAYESPRVRFNFIDEEDGSTYPGWVVRPYRYIYGLQEWYARQEVIPGSLITIRQGEKLGEVFIRARKKRPTKEWLRTVLIGSDGGIVFTMLKHTVGVEYDERMIIIIPDPERLDQVWEQTHRQRVPLERIVRSMTKELAKLNPQGHVHAQELYAAVNLVKRCPPSALLAILASLPNISHLGDLYFRLSEEEASHE